MGSPCYAAEKDTQASAFWGKMQFKEGGDRFAAGIALARGFPVARFLFTTGSGALRDIAGAAVSEVSIAEQVLPVQDRLLLEGRSRNTAENASLSPVRMRLGCWVASAFHMPRAVQSFEAAVWLGLVAWPVIIVDRDLPLTSTGISQGIYRL